MSTRGSVELIRWGKERGINVTAEVCPHHISLTEDAVEGYDTNAKMNPPLRTADDVAALQEAVRDGTIDLIATDHAPHHYDEKEREFADAPNGIIGLETALAVNITWLVAPRDHRSAAADRAHVVRAGARVPAARRNAASRLRRPTSRCSIRTASGWSIRRAFRSKGRNTPYAGQTLRGRVRCDDRRRPRRSHRRRGVMTARRDRGDARGRGDRPRLPAAVRARAGRRPGRERVGPTRRTARFSSRPAGCRRWMLPRMIWSSSDLEGSSARGPAPRRRASWRCICASTTARPTSRAVVHAHPPTATGFAVAGESFMAPVLPEVILQMGAVPLVPYATPGTEALADAMRAISRSTRRISAGESRSDDAGADARRRAPANGKSGARGADSARRARGSGKCERVERRATCDALRACGARIER